MLSKGCYPRKALFVITDGMDNASRASLDTTIARASQARVPIYSIGIGNPNVHAGSFLGFTSNDMETVDTKALSQLANATGGETFVVTLNDSGQAFKHAAGAIADNINGQYIVGFVGDGSTNQLRLEAPSHKQIEFRILSHD